MRVETILCNSRFSILPVLRLFSYFDRCASMNASYLGETMRMTKRSNKKQRTNYIKYTSLRRGLAFGVLNAGLRTLVGELVDIFESMRPRK